MTYNTINDAVTMPGGERMLAGRYRIVKQLGQGGMGSVWLVEDTQLDNKQFAVKMLPSILVSNKRAYRQLKDEALVAMKLTHPNIVTLRAFEENDGNPFLVMDYIDGQTLDDYLAERTPSPLRGTPPIPDGTGGESMAANNSSPETGEVAAGRRGMTFGLPEAEVIRILKPVAAALDYAHTKGVVHRDVKPGNVMIAKDGTPYVLDFGIAREMQETMTRVTGKPSSGTLLYMSPEQLRGQPPSAAQDVYSFAAMAYECLKGKPPFSHGQIEYQIINEQPEPLPNSPSKIEGVAEGRGSMPLARSVMSGLAKKPEDRPATCLGVLEGRDFNRVEHAERVEGGYGRARSPSAPQSGKGCLGKAIGFLALIAALAGGAWWWTGRQSPNSPSPIGDKAESPGGVGTEGPGLTNGAGGTGVGVEDLNSMSNGVDTGGVLTASNSNTNHLPEGSQPYPIGGDNDTGEVARPLSGSDTNEMQLAISLPGTHTAEKVADVLPPAPSDGAKTNKCPYEPFEHKELTLSSGVTMTMIYVSENLSEGITNGFWLGETEVSQEQWNSVVKDGKKTYSEGEGDLPVVNVSWNDCQRFITNIQEEAGKEFPEFRASLPSEAQWEYACRAGAEKNDPYGKDKDGKSGNMDSMAWHFRNSGKKAHPVKEESRQSRVNQWGFYNMHGNVWEWCDRSERYCKKSTYCGGSYCSKECKTDSRSQAELDFRSLEVGFRIALTEER